MTERMKRLPATVALTLFAIGVSFGAAKPLRAQAKNPYSLDAKAAKLGESQFRSNCAFCHGLGARGGGRGPDLSRVQKRHGNSEEEFFRTVPEGIAGTAMPPATAGGIGAGMRVEE